MKLKNTTDSPRLAAFTMLGSANAAVLLTDNFNTDGGRPPGGVPGGTASFNAYLSSDQGGTLATNYLFGFQ